MLGPGVDLQDLTQEVFLRFFGKVKELKKRESLRSFVMAIAIRRAQEEIKRRRVRRWFAPLLGDAMMRPATTEMDPEAREAIVHLYETIDRLNVRDRTIYILRFIEGLEQGEISQTMGISVSTVRRRLERLTKRVNSLMNSDPVLSQYLARAARAGRRSAEPRKPWPRRRRRRPDEPRPTTTSPTPTDCRTPERCRSSARQLPFKTCLLATERW